MFKTPILFLIFNRLDTAQRVFEKIKEQKPKYLYIAADWPRKDKKWEAEACKKTREEILKQINRDCELKTLFRDENLWCKMAVSWAITWFFENVEQWIILEDDCLPDSSFFGFCESMLEKYKADERIMMVSGDCFLPEKWQKENKYAFTNYAHIWGWASWRRAWNLYDIEMKDFDEFVKVGAIHRFSSNYFYKKVSLHNLKLAYDWKVDTWDYQRWYCLLKNNALSIFPLVNLINNIWFSKEALHTRNGFWLSNLVNNTIDYKNIKHPNIIGINDEFRKYDEKKVQLYFRWYLAITLKKIWLYKIVTKILWYN